MVRYTAVLDHIARFLVIGEALADASGSELSRSLSWSVKTFCKQKIKTFISGLQMHQIIELSLKINFLPSFAYK